MDAHVLRPARARGAVPSSAFDVEVGRLSDDLRPRGRDRYEPGGDSVFGRIPKIVTDVQPSVVAMMHDNGEGSGVIFASDGTIVTNNRVVEGTQSVRVVFATGETVSARVVATDPLSDLAVLKAYRDGLPAVVPQSGAAAAGFRPGDDLRIEILRNGDDQTLTARLTNRPS